MAGRVADTIQQLRDRVAAGGDGADLNAILQRAATQLEELDAAPPPPDNTVRDIMAREAAHAMRTDRERALAKEDMHDDDEFIAILHESGDENARKAARLISITARYAGELQHTLINPRKRKLLKDAKLDGIDDTMELWREIQLGGNAWDDIVDPGLAGNARIACQNVADALPNLHGLQVDDILSYGGENHKELLDYFCAAVAARWRSTTVFAAGPYKTGNEQSAVRIALKDALQLCRDYRLVDRTIEWNPRPKAPTCIAEIPANRSGPVYTVYPARQAYGSIDTRPSRPHFSTWYPY